MELEFFRKYFPVIAKGKQPYAWQEKLFVLMASGNWPDSVALPTGSGKTSIIQIWLMALSWTSLKPGAIIPRRLFWVVNRRVVVDQATEEVTAIAAALNDLKLAGDDLLVDGLTKCSHGGRLLAVSTLRGERADNREWCTDPSVPAVVIGTVDMIGSRLLFRGYGDGKYFRPFHAGLIGVDALVVNDESHLTPAFARLLVALGERGPASELQGKVFRFLLVSATDRGLGERRFDFNLSENLEQSSRLQKVFEAEKRLRLHPVEDKKKAEEKLLELAIEEPTTRTIIFVERPEDAAKFADKIAKSKGIDRVALLTGTMRGLERDRLARDSAAFRSFQVAEQAVTPVWLVATSAGEVGINISGERLVTMLTESDHLLQRLGRLNRFGDQDGEPHRVGRAEVVHIVPKKEGGGGEKDKRVTPSDETLTYLLQLPAQAGDRDVSCRSLHENPPKANTRSEEPRIARLEDWVIDLWSQTTVGNSVVPRVEDWLHGKQESEAPDTTVVWREEVGILALPTVSSEDRDQAARFYRVLPHERLSEPSGRVLAKLVKIAENEGNRPVLVLSADGEAIASTVSKVADGSVDLKYGTLLLEPGCGGLVRGMLRELAGTDTVYDVADLVEYEQRCRYLARFDGDAWSWKKLGTDQPPEVGPDPTNTASIKQKARELGLRPPLVIAIPDITEDDDATANRFLVLFSGRATPNAGRKAIDLDEHCQSVQQHATALAERLVGSELSKSFAEAGKLHDRGKANELWQRAMGGNVEKPLAKTVKAPAPQLLAGFRHELASLVDSPKETDDLALYLVGSHHGWGRPYWEPRAFDRMRTAESREAAENGTRRFGELQRKYGHWGLAYLDALFKASDGAVSALEVDGGE